MSAATRAKLSAAAKARWAKQQGGSRLGAGSASSAKKSSPKKGGITPEGRRKLSEMMRARWAARRRGKK